MAHSPLRQHPGQGRNVQRGAELTRGVGCSVCTLVWTPTKQQPQSFAEQAGGTPMLSWIEHGTTTLVPVTVS